MTCSIGTLDVRVCRFYSLDVNNRASLLFGNGVIPVGNGGGVFGSRDRSPVLVSIALIYDVTA